jgi:hypothetical protein
LLDGSKDILRVCDVISENFDSSKGLRRTRVKVYHEYFPIQYMCVIMSNKDEKMAEKFKELSIVEIDYAVKLDAEVRGYGNEIFRDIIGSIAIDSRKHSGLFKACAAICNGESLSLSEDEYNELVESLQKHETVEGNMIKTVDEMLTKTRDDRIRMMLNHIEGDEI